MNAARTTPAMESLQPAPPTVEQVKRTIPDAIRDGRSAPGERQKAIRVEHEQTLRAIADHNRAAASALELLSPNPASAFRASNPDRIPGPVRCSAFRSPCSSCCRSSSRLRWRGGR